MSHADWIRGQLTPYRPTLDLAPLVETVNRLYHALEAESYDRRHPEIFAELPPLWTDLLERAVARIGRPQLSVLDIGCGTGFEAAQALNFLGSAALARMACHDPSPDMLLRARARLAPRLPHAEFSTDLAAILSSGSRFDLVLTNSLLHHLPAPLALVRGLAAALAEDAVWIAGHEPSRRFWKNPECVATLQAYERETRWKRWLAPQRYAGRIRLMLGLDTDVARLTARRAAEAGLFERTPPPGLVQRLVDFHVAHSEQEAGIGRGFDIRELERDLDRDWLLIWTRSYSHMGPVCETRLTPRWRQRAEDLARRFPDDGGNFCSLWQRKGLSMA